MLYLLHLFVAVVVLSIKADGRSLSEYVHYPKVGYLKLHWPADWRTARLKCFEEDALLASPENGHLLHAMLSAINATFRIPQDVFTGIHNLYSRRIFNSLEGNPLRQMTTHSDTSSINLNPTNEDSCLTMDQSGMLKYSKCTEELPYICYKKDPFTTHNCGPDENGYKFSSDTNHCYKLYSTPRTWSDAYATCFDDGGHLAIINSETEARVLTDLYAKAKTNALEPLSEVVALGFTDLNNLTTWITIHGQTLKAAGYEKWAPNQPDDKGCHFGAMYGNNGLLDNISNMNVNSFVCEKNPTVSSTAGSEKQNTHVHTHDHDHDIHNTHIHTHDIHTG